MLRFYFRRGRRDVGACALAERVWSFSLRDDLVPRLPPSPSPSRKSAIGGGSLRHALTASSALLRSPTIPSTTTTARVNDRQQQGDDVTQEAPSMFIQAGRAGGHLFHDGWVVMGMRDGRRKGKNR